MSDNEGKKNNIVSLDDKRIERLTQRGHYFTMLEQFELLRLKFIYGDTMNKKEALDFITMCKYFVKYGHSEPFRYSCEQILKKYIEPHGLLS